ncbi:hypothetical protein YTPLAS18_14680 [Nitrospira sp.]|nr:hypothetical protein YTPLAS18_14680 [Nitrospira sp.]
MHHILTVPTAVRTFSRMLCGLAVLLLPWPSLAAGQVTAQVACSNPSASRIEVFYVNGVTTTLDEARVNAGYLEREFLSRLSGFPAELQAVCYEFQLNYNPTDGEMGDFAEAGQQRVGLSPTAFWQGLHSAVVFAPLLGELQQRVASASQIDQSAIDQHAARYRQEILPPSCRRVLVVPHSQGNLYTNAAVDLVYTGPQPIPAAGSLKIVGVATPASIVKGDGRYRTSSGDSLINAIRLTFPSTLPANTSWGPMLLPLLTPMYSGGHSFIGYLTFDPSRTDVLADMQASLLELMAANPCP